MLGFCAQPDLQQATRPTGLLDKCAAALAGGLAIGVAVHENTIAPRAFCRVAGTVGCFQHTVDGSATGIDSYDADGYREVDGLIAVSESIVSGCAVHGLGNALYLGQ
jgi:hypothetical protein